MTGGALLGRRVLIVGGAGQMGRAVAHRAIAAGASVLLAGRDRTALIEAAETLAGAEVIVADATDEDGVKRIVAEAGRVDDAVVAVSAGARATSIPRTDLADAQAAFSKVWASYAMLHHAPDYIATGGSLTLLSGSSARRPGAGFGAGRRCMQPSRVSRERPPSSWRRSGSTWSLRAASA